MPFASIEERRAFERTRNRRTYHSAYMVTWRRRADRAALAAMPTGKSAAVDALRAQLKASHDPAIRQRLRAALDHAVKLYSGERVRPRDPERASLSRPHVIGIKINAAPCGPDDDRRPIAGPEGSWMDTRLGPS